MKKLILSLVMMVMLSGCIHSSKDSLKSERFKDQISGKELYTFSNINNFRYKFSVDENVTFLDGKVSSENLSGASTWMIHLKFTLEEYTMEILEWRDKKTLRCLSMKTIYSAYENSRESEIPCRESQESSATQVYFRMILEPQETLKLVGEEEVVVPAGTFTCYVYRFSSGRETLTFYLAPNVPMPVKIEGMTKNGVLVELELVSYSLEE